MGATREVNLLFVPRKTRDLVRMKVSVTVSLFSLSVCIYLDNEILYPYKTYRQTGAWNKCKLIANKWHIYCRQKSPVIGRENRTKVALQKCTKKHVSISSALFLHFQENAAGSDLKNEMFAFLMRCSRSRSRLIPPPPGSWRGEGNVEAFWIWDPFRAPLVFMGASSVNWALIRRKMAAA